jgi:hypothetical protein
MEALTIKEVQKTPTARRNQSIALMQVCMRGLTVATSVMCEF